MMTKGVCKEERHVLRAKGIYDSQMSTCEGQRGMLEYQKDNIKRITLVLCV